MQICTEIWDGSGRPFLESSSGSRGIRNSCNSQRAPSSALVRPGCAARKCAFGRYDLPRDIFDLCPYWRRSPAI